VNVLYFASHQAWPITTGAELRDGNLARQLASRCSVTVAELLPIGEKQREPPERFGFEGVFSLEKSRTYTLSKILRGLAGPTPMTILNCWSVRSASQLAGLLQSHKFDIAQVEGVHLMEYLPIIRNAPGSPSILVDWHNIESEIMLRFAKTTGNWAKKIAAIRTAKLIERAEDQLLDTCATHTVTSERERRKLLARRPKVNAHVIPNGVDTSSYAPEKIAESRHQNNRRNSRNSILFVGYMNYHANIDAVRWFCREAWPAIRRSHPDLQFTIVGRDPAPEVRALESDHVHVTGTVEDVRPFYASAVAAVVPLRSGSGTRLKILEAMAAGVPVVSTRLGAEGIDAEDNVHLLLADSRLEFASAIARIVLSAETRNRLAGAGRDLVTDRYDWSVIGEELYRIHCDLAQARRSKAS